MKFINDRLGSRTTADLNLQSDREKYVRNHPELSESIKGAILKGQIAKGMAEEDVKVVMLNPSTIDQHTVGDAVVTTWNYCFGDTIMGIDFENGSVREFDSRSGEHGVRDCKSASREMWIMRRGRDSGK